MTRARMEKTGSQHDGTERLAVNNTILRRWRTLITLKLITTFRRRYGSCIPISSRWIVKRGPNAHLTEAATLGFIREHTSIPVPEVYTAFVHNDTAYIVMQRMPGTDLPEQWAQMTEEKRTRVFGQLESMLAELRALKPPEQGVASCVGGSLHDCRIPRSSPRFGPFGTIQEFHLWLREGLTVTDRRSHLNDKDWHDIESMITRQDGPWPAPVFTHGDLNPFNIRIDQDGNVVGIIDWEFSGWYPHYWEYTSAWYGARIREDWQESLQRFLKPCPEELKMEITRQKWWGDL